MYKIVRKMELNSAVTLLEIEAPFIAKKAHAGQFIIFRIDDQGERVPLTLARDEQKESGDIEAPVALTLKDGKPVVNQLDAEDGETVRFLLKTADGDLLLTDYASCGKHWLEERNRISVWLNR